MWPRVRSFWRRICFSPEIAEKQEYLIKKASILATLEAENKAKQDLLNESLETPEIAEEISNENDVKQD